MLALKVYNLKQYLYMTNFESAGMTHTHEMYEMLVQRGLLRKEESTELNYEVEYELVESEIKKFEKIAGVMYADEDLVSLRSRSIGQISFLREAMNALDDEALYEFIRENQLSTKTSINKHILDRIRSYSSLTKKMQKVEANGSKVGLGNVDFETIGAQLDDLHVTNLKETIYTLIDDDSSTMSPALGGQLQLLFGKRRPPIGVSIDVVEAAMQQSAAQLRNKLAKSKQSPTEEHIKYGLRYLGDVLGYNRETMQSINSLVQLELFRQKEGSALTAKIIKDVIERCIAAALESLYRE